LLNFVDNNVDLLLVLKQNGHKRHHHMHKVYDCEESSRDLHSVYGLYCLPLHPTRSALLSFDFAAPKFLNISGLCVPLSTLNSTPYDAKPMTRGLGCLLGITEQRTFTSNLLPIYLGLDGQIFLLVHSNVFICLTIALSCFHSDGQNNAYHLLKIDSQVYQLAFVR
jgi:hypothetical protein